jgi:hypothetical protein
MPRIWTIPLFVAFATCADWSPASAQVPSCNLQAIGATLAASNQIPSLRGCNPNAAQSLLGQFDYSLTIARHVHSGEIPEGLIVRQRVESGTVFVDVSTGPSHHQHVGGEILTGIAGAILNSVATSHPSAPPAEPPTSDTPPAEPNPAPGTPTPIETAPPPSLPTPLDGGTPTPTPPAPTPPADTPPAPTGVGPPAASSPATHGGGHAPTHNQVAEATPVAAPHVEATAAGPSDDAQTQPKPRSQFSIEGKLRVREGDDIQFVIRRQGEDRSDHRVELAYSDLSLLADPPSSFDFPAGPPDEASLRLKTVTRSGDDRDHELIVRLARVESADIGDANKATAVILAPVAAPRPQAPPPTPPPPPRPWWLKLLLDASSSPALILSLGTVLVASALGLVFFPRATCSLEIGPPSLGSHPLTSRWPAISATTVLGSGSVSIPHPLPIERQIDAEPSPA